MTNPLIISKNYAIISKKYYQKTIINKPTTKVLNSDDIKNLRNLLFVLSSSSLFSSSSIDFTTTPCFFTEHNWPQP